MEKPARSEVHEYPQTIVRVTIAAQVEFRAADKLTN
jgi:hypothetical protein